MGLPASCLRNTTAACACVRACAPAGRVCPRTRGHGVAQRTGLGVRVGCGMNHFLWRRGREREALQYGVSCRCPLPTDPPACPAPQLSLLQLWQRRGEGPPACGGSLHFKQQHLRRVPRPPAPPRLRAVSCGQSVSGSPNRPSGAWKTRLPSPVWQGPQVQLGLARWILDLRVGTGGQSTRSREAQPHFPNCAGDLGVLVHRSRSF